MKRFRLALLAIGAIACLTSALVAVPAEAAPRTTAHGSVVVGPWYLPGNASAIAPIRGNDIAYRCQYNAWVSTPVEWTCALYTTTGDRVDGHSGSSSRQAFASPLSGWYYHPSQLGKAYCTHASAYNADGGDSDVKCP
jgi:hypothetical protein